MVDAQLAGNYVFPATREVESSLNVIPRSRVRGLKIMRNDAGNRQTTVNPWYCRLIVCVLVAREAE